MEITHVTQKRIVPVKQRARREGRPKYNLLNVHLDACVVKKQIRENRILDSFRVVCSVLPKPSLIDLQDIHSPRKGQALVHRVRRFRFGVDMRSCREK
jgi:hypothetical protein